MTPSDREFGRLEGKVDGLVELVGDLRRTNSEEHRLTSARFDNLEASLRGALESKADRTVVEEQGKRVDSLEATRDKRFGRDGFVKGAWGAGLSLLGLLIANKGHL